MPNDQLQIIAVQTYGYIDGPNDHRSGAQGSRARIDEALDLAKELSRSNDVLFLFPQGYGKMYPSVRGKRPPSLGESMARYIESRLRGRYPKIRVIFEPLSWGTLDDIRSLPRMLAKIHPGEIPHVHFVTDPTHLKRVRLVWRYVCPKGWDASFHPAKKHRMTWKERWLREPVARLKYWYQLNRAR